MSLGSLCTFVPPYLLERIAASTHDASEACRRTLRLDSGVRAVRTTLAAPARQGDAAWVVDTAANGSALPGTLVRSAGGPATGDAAVDEAGDGVAAALALFGDVYGRDSYDGAGAQVVSTVHYEQGYDNAFWNGTQLVFGDGDGQVFGRFTRPVDVLGHELTHAVTERTAGLTYEGQPGALNESVSDVFASCLKQRLLGQSADQGDWLIGQGVFLPGIHARALRDMAAPGTAYDDPTLGQDPQVGHMRDYVTTSEDNGGVHTNSGIPNRAFQLAAVAVGGSAAEGAGRIWYAALTGGQVGPDTDFAGFAAATVAAAGPHADAVRQAWETVGVTASTSSPAPAPASRPTLLTVQRSGGFAGRVVEGSVDLASDDPRAARAQELVSRVDLTGPVVGEPPRPDMFVYSFGLGDRSLTVAEHALTPDLRDLAGVVLEG